MARNSRRDLTAWYISALNQVYHFRPLATVFSQEKMAQLPCAQFNKVSCTLLFKSHSLGLSYPCPVFFGTSIPVSNSYFC